MKYIKFCLQVAQVAGICLLGLGQASAAGVVELSYGVQQQGDGYVAFDLELKNIGQYDIHDVRAEAPSAGVAMLYYNDVAPGDTLSQPVQYSWDSAGDPPNMDWQVSYSDASGVRHVETMEE